jgi:O-acetyl-ADP-ribose deacetylase (regulator of RNase III)
MTTPISRRSLAHGVLCASRGSVVDFGKGTGWPRADVAIVNAANRGGLGGGGVDGAISRAGGAALQAARKALPTKPTKNGGVCRIDTGGAVATGPDEAFGTYAATVVHAVGPNYRVRSDASASDALLASAYTEAMARAAEAKIKYLGFSLISAGIFRGSRSLRDVLEIGVKSVSQAAYPGLEEVHFVAYTQNEADLLEGLMA